MAKEIEKFEFTQDILGSNNGIDVKEYKKGDLIAKQDLSEDLFTAWEKREIIIPLNVNNKGQNENQKPDGEGKEAKEDVNNELTEEEKAKLIGDAKALLNVTEQDKIDTDTLKQIGIKLGIKNMDKSVNPDTIVKKVKQYLEEVEANADTKAE